MPVRTFRLPGKYQVWVVCTLASLLVTTNTVRPIQTIYQYSANVVASENRFTSLEHAEHAKGCPFVQLRPIADLLLERPYQASVSATIPNLNVRAVDVYHGTRLTSEQLSKNLVEGSESGRTKTIEEEQSKNARWNRWRIDVLEHQIKQANLGQQVEEGVASVDEGEKVSPYRLVSAPQKSSSGGDLLSTLEAELAEREQLDKFQDFIFKQRAAAGEGIISLSTPWQIRMAIQSANGWSLSVCLLLSLAIAFCHSNVLRIVTWFKSMVRRSNDFDKIMRGMRIEVLCSVGNNTEQIQESMPLGLSSRDILFRYLGYVASEWVILLAMAISCARFVFDPLWRDLLLYSPLAALNSLVYLF